MSFSFYETDDTTPTTGGDFLAVAAGTSSAALQFHVWWGKGVSSATAHDRLYFRARIAGAYDGHALLDQRAFEMRITGSDNPDSDPDFVPFTTSWQRIGTNAVLECPPMRSNTALYMEVRLSPATQHVGTTASVAYDIVPVYNEPLPWEGDRQLAHGILTGVGDGETSEWIEQVGVAETGTPDDKANVAARTWLWFGTAYSAIAQAVTLNQNDGDSAALGVGESYIARLSQDGDGSTVTTTKGSKAASNPETPALPAGHLPIATVEVVYDAGGSTIVTANITLDADNVDSRFRPIAGTGLELLVGKGKAVSPTGGITQNEAEVSVTLTASVTRYVWLIPGGSISQTTANEPPIIGAIPIATVITDGSGPTTITDTRKYADGFNDAIFKSDVTPDTDDAWDLGASGTQFQNAYISRAILGGKSKTLTDNVATTFATFTIADAASHDGEIIYTIHAVDGTSLQHLKGRAQFSATREGSTYTVSIAALHADVVAAVTGTLTGGIEISGTAGVITLKANFNSSLASPTITGTFRFDTTDTGLALTFP